MAAPVTSFRPAPVVTEALALNGGGRSMSNRLAQIADRYSEILRRTPLPELSEAEWSLLRDACNGTLHEPAAMIRGALAIVADDAIAMDGLAEKWGVDGPGLVERLRGLSYPQEVRVVEAIERWWAESTA